MSEEKKVTRLIELTLGFKNQGPDAAAMFAQINQEVANFKSSNPGATYAQVANHVYNYSKALGSLNKGLVQSVKEQQTATKATDKWIAGLQQVQKTCIGLMAPLQGLAGLVGGESIGFGAGIKWVNAYQKQMLGLSAQMSKYGRGMGDIDAAITRVGKSTGLTMQETADLYSAYEKGFPYNSLENGEKLFNNIKQAVGGNAQAMGEMSNMLSGMIDKFPELEDAITNVNEGGNRKMLETQSRLAYMTGQLSLAEHKRFQDYIRGGKQANSADDQRRKEMQAQVDAMNRLRQAFEQVAKQIGETLLPLIEDFSRWVQKILPQVLPWVPTITKVALGLTAALGVLKAISVVVKGIDLAKALSGKMPSLGGGSGGMLKNVGSSLWKNLGPGAGTGGMSGFMAKAGLGAAAGQVAGMAVDAGYEHFTGKELDKDGASDGTQMRATGGQMLKAGSMIGAGFAAGGVPGAVAAGALYDIKGIYQIGKTSLEIRSTWADIGKANEKIGEKWNQIIGNAKEKEKAAEATGDDKQITRAKRNTQVQELRGQADKLESGAKGMFWDDDEALAKAKQLREQANSLQKQNNKEVRQESTEKSTSVLSKYKIDLDDTQLQKLQNIIDAAGSGDGQILKDYGVSKFGQDNASSIVKQGQGSEFEQMIVRVAEGVSGKRAANQPLNAVGPLSPGDNSNAIKAAANNIQDLIGSNDLAGASRSQKSMMELMDNTQASNAISTTAAPVKDTLKNYGVNTDRLGESGFKMKDEIWGQLDGAKGKIQSEMDAMTEKAGGNPLSGDDQKRMDMLKQAQETINSQLEERYKIQDKFGPQLQLIDAAYNEHSKAVEATNNLLQSQKALLSATVSNAQVTGKVDFGDMQGKSQAAIQSLQSYNEGLKQQLALEMQELALAKEEMDQEIATNAEKIKNLRDANGADGKPKSQDQAEKDAKAADALELQNKQLDIRRQRNVLNQNAQAKINSQLEQTSTMQKQIVEILQSQLEANQANVQYAAANVSKSEALIEIYDNMGAGLKASAEMRMQAANQMGNQIQEEKKNLDMINQTIAQGIPAMAQEVGKEKEFAGKSPEEIMAEAKKRLISLDTQRVQKETTILGLVNKQAQMTKSIRDGYVSAIMAMTAGSGVFNKILITQDKNMGVGVKYMNVLQSKKSGGIGGGKTQAGQFTVDQGLVDNDQSKGYKTWDGMDSNNNDVAQIQQNALGYTQQRNAGVTSGAAGAFSGNANTAGAALQQSAQGNNVMPPAGPPTNNGGTLPIGPAGAPGPAVTTGTVGGAAPASPTTPVTPASQPTTDVSTLLRSMNDTETASLAVLREIAAKINGAGQTPTQPAGARNGGVVGRFREGGLVGLYRDGGGVSGLTKGESEKGDQYQIGVAGGEVIMNQRQWPRVASALGMSSDEFANMVQSKDYSRLPDAKFREGGVAGGKKPQTPNFDPKPIKFVYDSTDDAVKYDDSQKDAFIVHAKPGALDEAKFTEWYKKTLESNKKAWEKDRNKASSETYSKMFGVDEDVSFGAKVIAPADKPAAPANGAAPAPAAPVGGAAPAATNNTAQPAAPVGPAPAPTPTPAGAAPAANAPVTPAAPANPTPAPTQPAAPVGPQPTPQPVATSEVGSLKSIDDKLAHANELLTLISQGRAQGQAATVAGVVGGAAVGPMTPSNKSPDATSKYVPPGQRLDQIGNTNAGVAPALPVPQSQEEAQAMKQIETLQTQKKAAEEHEMNQKKLEAAKSDYARAGNMHQSALNVVNAERKDGNDGGWFSGPTDSFKAAKKSQKDTLDTLNEKGAIVNYLEKQKDTYKGPSSSELAQQIAATQQKLKQANPRPAVDAAKPAIASGTVAGTAVAQAPANPQNAIPAGTKPETVAATNGSPVATETKVLPPSSPTVNGAAVTNTQQTQQGQQPMVFQMNGGININYGDLSKMLAAAKQQVDSALEKVAQQMAGGRSTLPRGTS